MKLGLDVHGVVDKDPSRFIKLAREVRRDGGEVILITGHPIDEQLYEELAACGFDEYDQIVSVQDELEKLGYPVLCLDRHGRNHYDDTAWASFKGIFCKEHGIDFHIDDTAHYLDFFETPCALYKDGNFVIFPHTSNVSLDGVKI
jgi:hypothetical protein